MKNLLLLLLITAFLFSNAIADSQAITGQGISGDMDSKSRTPVLSIGTEFTEGGGVKILASAYVPNDQYKKYPIQFDFFVNRRLFVSQMNSAELPGAVGVDVGPDIATPPFNYSVVAKVLHPNREFTTVIHGAVFALNLVTKFDCTLTLPNSDASGSDTVVVNDVETTQIDSNTLGITLKGKEASSEKDVTLSTTVTLVGTNASSTLDLTRDDTPSSAAVTGTVTLTDKKLTEISLASADGETTLVCS